MPDRLFAGPGEMRARCRAFDWTATPLGPVSTWPAELRSAVQICLAAVFPATVHAGPEQLFFYNDAYAASVFGQSAERAAALGRPAREGLADRWTEFAPLYAEVRNTGSLVFEDRPFTFDRGNGPETTYWTSSLASIRDADGNILGIFAHSIETTGRVREAEAQREHDRRREFLLRLGDALRPLIDPGEIQLTATLLLGEHLDVARVVYGEIIDETICVIHRDYARDGSSIAGRFHTVDFGQMTIDAYRAGLPVVFEDTETDERLSDAERAAYRSIGSRSNLSVGLVKAGRWVAGFGVLDARPRHWSSADVQLLTEAAERIWEAVERATVEAAVRESERRQAFLLRFGDLLRTLADDEEIFQTAAGLLGEYLDVDRCFFGELFPEEDLVIVHRDHARGALPRLAGRFKISDFQQTVDALAGGFTVPLFKEGTLVVDLRVVSGRSREWSAAELQLAEEIAERTWTSVERIRALTALQASEDQYRSSEERYRIFTELAPALLWEVDPSGVDVSLITGGWSEYTGQSLEDAQNGGWLNTIHPDDRTQSALLFADAFATGNPLEVEQRIRRRDGAYRWFLVRQLPVRDSAGQVVRWVGLAADIHAQRLALAEVERLVTERTSERDELRRQLLEAEEAERRRLARELHDQLGQHLTGLALGLEDARRLAADTPSADVERVLAPRLNQLLSIVREVTTGARYVALELRPPELDDVGFENALETYVREWGARYQISVEFMTTGEIAPALTIDAGSALYRIAQEALTNVAKHAHAAQVSVIVAHAAGEVRLLIEDDGRGFDLAATELRARRERRLGIAGMRERAALLGGEVRIETSSTRGTTVFARLPQGARGSTNESESLTVQRDVPIDADCLEEIGVVAHHQ